MELYAIELIPHPESDVEPLKLEELIASLYSVKQPISFEITYIDKYIRIYVVGPKDVLENLKKSLKTLFGKVIIEDAKPPSLRDVLATSKCLEYDEKKRRFKVRKDCRWYVAELKLSKPMYYVFVKHSEKKPIENNPIDVVLASMKPRSYIQIVFYPEPRGKQLIADWVYQKTTGKSTSITKQIINDLVDILSPSALSDRPYYYERERLYYQYHWRQMLLDLEKDQIKQAQLKMASPLFSVRIRIYADDPGKVNEIASSFNQFSGNSFTWKVRRVEDEDIEVAESRKPLKLGWLFKDKKLPILSARELALFVNLPTPTSSLPLRTGYVALEPPPELKDLGYVRKELSVDDLEEFAKRGLVLLGFFGDKGYGIPIDEFRKSHKAIFGTTGAGKSSFARYLMLSILKAYGCGNVSIIYIDPNGDDAIKLLKLIPEECLDNVVYIDPRTVDFFGKVARINPIEYRDEKEREFVIAAFMGAMESVFRRFWGPSLADIFRNALKLVTSAGLGRYKLSDVVKVLRNEEHRAKFLGMCSDPEVVEFFTKEFPKLLSSRDSQNRIYAVTNKLRPLLSGYLRHIFDTYRSDIDMVEALDSGKIIIVNMGVLKGLTEAQYLFGSLFLAKVLIAIFSRALRGEASRKPVFVFIDELHNFVGPALAKMISSMLAETRKFNAFFVLMTQYPKQLPKELRAAIYELTDIYCFKVGLESARELRKVFEPWITDHDLINIEFYTYTARIRHRARWLRPFTLKAPYIPVSIEGNPYTEDPVSSVRIARALERYGSEVTEAKLAKIGIEVRYSPLAYVAAYELYRMGGEASVSQVVELLKSLGIARDFFEAIEKLKSVAEEGAILVEGDRVSLSQEAKKLFEIEFADNPSTGGDLHREIVKDVAEQLMEQHHYVWVDTEGSEEKPDIVAIPASRDLDEWLYEQTMCVEVEAFPRKKTTFEKLAQILKRCYRAGCSYIKIVVPSEDDRKVVESRLGEVLARRRNVATAMGIPLEWMESVRIEVEVYSRRATEESGPRTEATEPGATDTKRLFLKWLYENLDRLLQAKAIAIDGERIYVTTKALELFRDETGVAIDSLAKLAEMLRDLGAEYSRFYIETEEGRRRVRAVAIPRSALDVHGTQNQVNGTQNRSKHGTNQ